MKYSLYIFRRDLRVYDNTALRLLSKVTDRIIPVFIFTPEQIDNNKYKSDNAIQFMCQSIQQLEIDLGCRINLFYGEKMYTF